MADGIEVQFDATVATIRDRVVQTAAKIVLEPIFEADFEDSAYGYRPRRGAIDAVKETHRLMCRGYTDVVDADLSKYFDTIPHAGLLKSVARRIVDRHVLWLIKLWLRVPVEERSGDGTRRMSGGRSNKRGTPQGGVASPLLSVIYMNRFLKHWRLTGRGEAFRAYIISYADDFVILSRGHAAEALTWTKAVMTKLGLTLNEAKTSVKDARCESFDFLGYTLGPRHLPNGGRWYLGASPSKKSVRRIKAKISALLTPGNKGAWPEVRMQLNRLLGGWSTTAMAPSLRRMKLLIDMSMTAQGISFANGTKCKGAAQTCSPVSTSTESWLCDAFGAGAAGRRRGPYNEASRKAGCGKSARSGLTSGEGKRNATKAAPRPSSTLQIRARSGTFSSTRTYRLQKRRAAIPVVRMR
jgi:RNA-directed DNA polymerase